MTFKAYLATRKPTTDPEGDLARLASASTFPEISTIAELKTYVISRYGSGPLSEAVPNLWKAYQSADKRS